MNYRYLTTLLTLLMSFLCATAAHADERAQKAVETRQGLLKVVGHYFGPIVGMARGQVPFDADLARANANKIAQLSPMIPDVFALEPPCAHLCYIYVSSASVTSIAHTWAFRSLSPSGLP